MTKRVCIDAGHKGKANMCPANNKYYESDMVWKLHLLQKKYLEQLGIEVVLTRETQNTDMSVTDRGKASENCDLFISDHSNAVGNGMNEDVDYVAVYHLTEDVNTKVDDISRDVAKKLAPVIADAMGVKQGYKVLTRKDSEDRNKDGVMNDNYYGVLHGARMVETPGLILEHSFHTNSKSVEWLLNDDNLDKLAKAEAECIASFLLGEEVKIDEELDVFYRVQVGAFRKKENAERQLAKLQADGYDAFIVVVEEVEPVIEAEKVEPVKKTAEEVAREIVLGKGDWGVNPLRRQRLTEAGYDAKEVQKIINSILL